MWLKRKRKKYSKGGFTLVEVLVAASILGVIGLVILTTFGSGFHVFERVQAFGGAQADVLLALEEMEKDIKNMFPHDAIPFEGDSQSIAFPALIEILEDEDDDESLLNTVGRISYYIDSATYLDESAKVLMKGQQNYSAATGGAAFDDDNSAVLARVESVAYEFYSYNEETEAYAWQSSWDSDGEDLLSGVKVAVTYKDGEQDITLERSVFIPSIQKIFDIEEEESGDDDGEDGDDGDEGGGDDA